MGKLLMLRDEDDARIVKLKRRLKAKSKVEVVRSGLALLEREAERAERVAQYRRAAALVRRSSAEFLRETERSRMRRLADLP
jgi:hypothetical protein